MNESMGGGSCLWDAAWERLRIAFSYVPSANARGGATVSRKPDVVGDGVHLVSIAGCGSRPKHSSPES